MYPVCMPSNYGCKVAEHFQKFPDVSKNVHNFPDISRNSGMFLEICQKCSTSATLPLTQ